VGNTISEIEWAKIKQMVRKNPQWTVGKLSNRMGRSETTIRRVRKSRSYADFKLILEEDRGPKYETRRKKKGGVLRRLFGK
jgi:hypothetical protein